MTYRQWTQSSKTHAGYREAATKCAAAFTTPRPDANEWVHPQTGEKRLYINNLTELVGLTLTYYNTGNISSASLAGGYISNNKAGRLAAWLNSTKVFIDGKGVIRVKAVGRNDHLDIDDLLEIVERACAVHGITNK